MSQASTDGGALDRVGLHAVNARSGSNAGNTGNAGNGSAAPFPGGVAGRVRNLTDRQKKVLAVALVVHAVVATFTWRDLRRRPATAVRGPKSLWRVAAILNTSGSLAYWLFGRKPQSTS